MSEFCKDHFDFAVNLEKWSKMRYNIHMQITQEKKTVYYTDELGDDFALTRDAIKARRPEGGFRYEHHFLLWRAGAWMLYRVVATPIVWAYCKAVYGLRIQGRRKILTVRGGCFLYGNHTQNIIDAFLPTMAAFPKRCNIITAPDAVSIPVIRHITPMLGAIPLPDSFEEIRAFQKTIKKSAEKGRALAVYPEAHIWPYYNKIRPFSDESFVYPCKYGVPAVPFTVTYRSRRILRKLPPAVTLVIGDPVYADRELSAREARRKMRDEVYEQMCRASEDSYEYIRYVKRQD